MFGSSQLRYVPLILLQSHLITKMPSCFILEEKMPVLPHREQHWIDVKDIHKGQIHNSELVCK